MFSGLGERIKQGRRKVGLEQKQLAKLMEVSVGTVSRWERETTRPSHSEMVLLAMFFQVNRMWLNTGVGSPDDPEPHSPFFSFTMDELLEGEQSAARRFAIRVLLDDLQSLMGTLNKMTDDQVAELAGVIRNALATFNK